MGQCPLLSQNGHRLIDPVASRHPGLLRNWAPASSCPTAQHRSPPMSVSRRTEYGLTQALVRRRFGIAGIITINPLLPHLHKGAGSKIINGFPNVLDFGKCVAPDRSLA